MAQEQPVENLQHIFRTHAGPNFHCKRLGVRRRRSRKRARGSRTPTPEATRPNHRWSLDFLSDTFGASRRFRTLAVNDDCCRENLCLMADTSISGTRVARELDALVRIYGTPASIVSDNGTEFTSRAIQNGPTTKTLSGSTSIQESRNRTLSSSHSMAASGTSC